MTTEQERTDWTLNANVWLHDEHGAHHPFGPGDTVPEWARGQVGAHLLTRTPEVPSEDHIENLLRETAEQFAEQATGQGTGPLLVEAPPSAGPGSNRSAWADYAHQLGLNVIDTWTRADIQEACAALTGEPR